MSDAQGTTGDSLHCPACGKRYRSAEWVGRDLPCNCGHVIRVPQAEPCLATDILGPDAADATDTYELAWDNDATSAPAAHGPPSQHCPVCNVAMTAGTIICLNCGYNVAQQQKMRTQLQAPTAAPPPVQDASHWQTLARSHGATVRTEPLTVDGAPGRFADWYLPLILIGAGVVFTLLNARMLGGPSIFTVYYLVYSIGLQLFVMVPLLLALLVLLAKLLDVNFGTLPTALLKLAAIAIGPLSIAQLISIWISQFTFGIGGLLFYGLSHFVCCAIFVGSMFDLDYFETVVTAMAIIILRFLVVSGLLMLFLNP